MANLQQDLDALVDLGVTGAHAQVTADQGRQVIAHSGVRDVDTRQPVNPASYFRIGSAGKMFVATVILQLVDEGWLSLDDTVEDHLPGVVRGNGNDGRFITVRDLLQHTGGLHDDLPGWDTPEQYCLHRYDTYTVAEIVARAMNHPPEEGWAYSNTGYVLAGMIIEEVTGRAWHEEVEDRIIEPLDLSHTFWPGESPSLPNPHARAYQLFPTSELVDTTEVIEPYAYGSHISTTRDLDQFLRSLLAGELLSPARLAEMQQTVPVSEDVGQLMPGARYGLGIFSRPLSCGGVYWGHPGGLAGYIIHTGITDDGDRSVVVSASTALGDLPDHMIAQEHLASALVDHALCASTEH